MIELRADMEATINDVCFEEGSFVRAGDTVIRLDCMKMMVPVYAPVDSYVYYHIRTGDYIQAGDLLATLQRSRVRPSEV